MPSNITYCCVLHSVQCNHCLRLLHVFLFFLQKASLLHLYGKNPKSNGKLHTAQEFISGKDFKNIAEIFHIAEATAQIYGIDAFAVGAPIDHVRLGNILQVTGGNFKTIRSCIEQNKDQDLKLRSIRDELFSYNQIRFVQGPNFVIFDTYRKSS